METEDIRSYSDQELSLRIFNDEGLYSMRNDDDFPALINRLFIYTPKQLQELIEDLKADREEN